MDNDSGALEVKIQQLEKENKSLKRDLKLYHRVEGSCYGLVFGALLGAGVQSALQAQYPEMMDFRILTLFAGTYFGCRYLGNFLHWYNVSLPSKQIAVPSISGENR